MSYKVYIGSRPLRGRLDVGYHVKFIGQFQKLR